MFHVKHVRYRPLTEPADSPLDAMRRAVTDLWSQPLQTGDDYIVFADHYGNPTRIRMDGDQYFVAWAVEDGNSSRWDEDPHSYDNPRHAALHAFQGPAKGRF